MTCIYISIGIWHTLPWPRKSNIQIVQDGGRPLPEHPADNQRIIITPHTKGRCPLVNSLAPGRGSSDFKSVISTHKLWIKFMSTYCETALRWMTQNIFDDKLTLVRVMAWCHQATSYYLNQCWQDVQRCGITRLQRVKSTDTLKPWTRWQPVCRRHFQMHFH